MSIQFAGLHHVTAIAGDPQENVDFYEGVLGLRLVKKTVNFDDPTSYHLYYGDSLGSPGTIMTFFSWPGAQRGRMGTGQVNATSFGIPEGSLGYWTERLVERGVRFEKPTKRFGETVLALEDPDGLAVELVARPETDGGEQTVWEGGPVPAEHAIRGIPGVTLSEEDGSITKDLLTDLLGFEQVAEEDGRARYLSRSPDGEPGGDFADVLVEPDGQRGLSSVGTVHHVAWRAPDEETQELWREEIAGRGLNVTPILERKYFRSIYFREPGGGLFEIATVGPGWTADEADEPRGESWKLPPWLEDDRGEIEKSLPPIRLPRQGG